MKNRPINSAPFPLARHTVGHKFGSKGRGTNGAGTAKGAGGGGGEGGGKEEEEGGNEIALIV